MSDCSPCPDEGNYHKILTESGHTGFTVPPIYFNPPDVGHPLKALELTLLRDGSEREFLRPVFGDDGSIEYPRRDGIVAVPDDIDGYQRDPDNAYRFMPNWEPCKLRGQGTSMKPSGCIDIVTACNNPESDKFGRPVKCADCLLCPVRKQ